MTDLQMLTIAIVVVVPLSGLIFSNSRISDVNNRIGDINNSLSKRMDDLRSSMDKRIDDLRTEMNRRFDIQQGLFEAILGKLEELDRRTSRL